MGSQQVLSALTEVLVLTQTMQKKSEEQLWEDITGLEQQRQKIIHTIFPINESDMSAQVQSQIQKIIDLNQELESQCRRAKQEVQVQMNSLTDNKKAAAAYGST